MSGRVAGVEEYIPATVTLFFEPDHIDCAHCQLLETYSRKQCRMTGVYIVDDRVTDPWCPLTFHRKEAEAENET